MKKAGNLYVTTITVLLSAVQKISRAMKLPEGLRLYRGVPDLPNEFFTADSQGRKGFVVWGFLSTTSDKQVGGRNENARSGQRGRGGPDVRGRGGA
jgi:hypothetical protein